MKINILTLALTLFTLAGGAQEYELRQFEMTVSGTSSLHDWVSDVTQAEATAALHWEEGALAGIDQLQVSIPVKSIQSAKGRIMDGKTWDALMAEQHPNIVFQLERADITKEGGKYWVQATGSLRLAGQARKVSLSAKGVPGANATFTFSGTYPIKMTDFGIEPPTAMMGTLKTGNEVLISYKVTFGLSGSGAGIGK